MTLTLSAAEVGLDPVWWGVTSASEELLPLAGAEFDLEAHAGAEAEAAEASVHPARLRGPPALTKVPEWRVWSRERAVTPAVASELVPLTCEWCSWHGRLRPPSVSGSDCPSASGRVPASLLLKASGLDARASWNSSGKDLWC